jgi:hypothetical protein
MPITLAGSVQTNDPRLDRLPQFDEASRAYPARTLLSAEEQVRPIRSWTWTLPVLLRQQPLDQGREGACVGFGWANELAARPYAIAGIEADDALWIYHRAQDLDEWPGSDYSGTSVLAGAKATQERGGLVEYRWGFTLDDVKRVVAWHGPVVLGLNWYTGMMRPDSDGRIRPTGDVEGGHCILMPRVRGPRYGTKRLRGTNWLWNSWGISNGWPWGWLTDDDLQRLLSEQGEACVPVVRSRVP